MVKEKKSEQSFEYKKIVFFLKNIAHAHAHTDICEINMPLHHSGDIYIIKYAGTPEDKPLHLKIHQHILICGNCELKQYNKYTLLTLCKLIYKARFRKSQHSNCCFVEQRIHKSSKWLIDCVTMCMTSSCLSFFVPHHKIH